MWKEGVDVSITGNSTNPTRFQHPVAGTYKKECIEQGKKYFSVPPAAVRAVPCIRTTCCRSRQLRHDRYHGPYALRRPVCRLQLRPAHVGDDGLPGHGRTTPWWVPPWRSPLPLPRARSKQPDSGAWKTGRPERFAANSIQPKRPGNSPGVLLRRVRPGRRREDAAQYPGCGP